MLCHCLIITYYCCSTNEFEVVYDIIIEMYKKWKENISISKYTSRNMRSPSLSF